MAIHLLLVIEIYTNTEMIVAGNMVTKEFRLNVDHPLMKKRCFNMIVLSSTSA
jgi:hypothetical protein